MLALALAMEEGVHSLEGEAPLSLLWGQSNPEVQLLLFHLVFPADQVDPSDLAVQEFRPSQRVLGDQVDRFLHPFQQSQAAL